MFISDFANHITAEIMRVNCCKQTVPQAAHRINLLIELFEPCFTVRSKAADFAFNLCSRSKNQWGMPIAAQLRAPGLFDVVEPASYKGGRG